SDEVIELMPESVARENVVLPFEDDAGQLTVLISNPGDDDTVEKLRFILNRDIKIALSPRTHILRTINRLYG
ncbi:MAG: type II/IV secretion system protein, partial [Proteobacteria bacterium]|nr:type II/IV secretion system protein [Pseudomonadota bacterium]